MVKYERVAEEIKKYINDQKLRQGDQLPSLENLVKEYGVSRNTVISALNLLESQGMVYQVRGSGIFVRGHRRKGHMSLLDTMGLKDELGEDRVRTKSIDMQLVEAPFYIKKELKLEPNEKVYYIKRLRYLDGNPLCIEYSYYRESIIPELTQDTLEDSIFGFLKEDVGLQIGFSDIIIKLDYFTPDESRIFEVEANEPSIVLESSIHLHNGVPFDYSIQKFIGEKASFFVQSMIS